MSSVMSLHRTVSGCPWNSLAKCPLGPPLLILKPRGCSYSEAEQKEVCSQDPLSRSRAAEDDTTLVAMVPPGSGSPGQEIIRDCLFVVPSLSQSV